MKEEIKKFFKGEVEDDNATLEKYSHDASIFELRPKLVLFPEDSEDVANLVRWVNENKTQYPDLSITARSAGTDMSGGAIGESLVLDFTRHMNRLIDFDPEKMTITVEPGMYYRDLEKLTLEKGLILPCYTASKTINAVGGMFGNNSAGERTLKYGKTEDYVIKSKVVFSDGSLCEVKSLNNEELEAKKSQADFEGRLYTNLYKLLTENYQLIQNAKPKVHKNSAGYYLWNIQKENNFDLNKLLVGSQGTLAIATEITFKLVPNYQYSKLVVFFLKDLSQLGELVKGVLKHRPETLESYDDKTMQLAVRFFPDFLKNKGLIGMIRFMWSFWPEAIMMLKRGFPKLIILAEFSGKDEEEAHQKCLALKNGMLDFSAQIRITKSEAEAGKYWDIRHDSFALLRKHIKGKRTAPFIDDFIVRPEFLPKFLPELNKILSEYDLVYTIAGHMGDGNFHIIPLIDFRRPDLSQIIVELSGKVYDLVLKYEGSITAEHNDGLIRTPYLEKMYGSAVVNIFKQTKEIFDPKYILNPGKKVGGTMAYLTSHIAKPEPPSQNHKI